MSWLQTGHFSWFDWLTFFFLFVYHNILYWEHAGNACLEKGMSPGDPGLRETADNTSLLRIGIHFHSLNSHDLCLPISITYFAKGYTKSWHICFRGYSYQWFPRELGYETCTWPLWCCPGTTFRIQTCISDSEVAWPGEAWGVDNQQELKACMYLDIGYFMELLKLHVTTRHSTWRLWMTRFFWYLYCLFCSQ